MEERNVFRPLVVTDGSSFGNVRNYIIICFPIIFFIQLYHCFGLVEKNFFDFIFVI